MVVYADEWTRGRTFSSIPLMVKAALLAFKYSGDNESVIPLVGLSSDTAISRFTVEIIDTMCDGSTGIILNCSKLESSEDLLTTVFERRQACKNMPAPQLVIGGTNSKERIELGAQLASALELPNIGIRSWQGDKDTQDNFYVRINPFSTQLARNAVDFLKAVAASEAMLWYCNDAQGQALKDEATLAGAEVGIFFRKAEISQGISTGSVPVIGTDLYTSWSELVTEANQEGMMYHLFAVGENCPVFDLIEYLALHDHGLEDGHLWVGVYPTEQFMADYLALFSTSQGLPMSAFVTLQEVHDEIVDDRLTNWWSMTSANDVEVEDWVKDFMADDTSLGAQDDSILELWPEERDHDAAPNGGGPRESYLFDALYAAQLAASAVWARTYALDKNELQDEIKQLDFNGLTGRVRFDTDGNRRMAYSAHQYRT